MPEENASVVCVCGHNTRRHRDQQGDDGLNFCLDCDCPEFCTAAAADEVTDLVYELALEQGEGWAEAAHEYRQHRWPL